LKILYMTSFSYIKSINEKHVAIFLGEITKTSNFE